MKEKEITVLMVAPHEHPKTVTLRNDLDALQEAVSIGSDYKGLIEIVPLEDDVCILCNEEGKLNGLEGNRRLGNDILCGVFYVVGDDGEGSLASLSAAQQEKYRSLFWSPDDIGDDEVRGSVFFRFYPM